MRSRPKTFLTFALLWIVPLLVISTFSFLSNLKFDETVLRAELEHEVVTTTTAFGVLLHDLEDELQNLAATPAVRKSLRAGNAMASAAEPDKATGSLTSRLSPAGADDFSEAKEEIARPLRDRFHAAIALFAPDKTLLLVAEPPRPQGNGEVLFRTSGVVPNLMQPDEAVWTTTEQRPICRVTAEATLGKTIRCTLPVFDWEENTRLHGALVADLKIDALLGFVGRQEESPAYGSGDLTPRVLALVLDRGGTVIYHTNDAHKHQAVNGSMPYFTRIAAAMIAERSGTDFFTSSTGDQWLATYSPLGRNGLSLAIARNYSQLTATTRWLGWLSVMLALLLGAAAAALMSHYYLKKIRSIDRVAEGVGAIAKGELDHHIELQSSDQLRPLADNLGLMTKQLRDQLAREAETQQFQSFVRLSAILTHDLKNAIEALSLTVANMERHFDNQEFRADAMKSVTGATDNLRALVARLSNPVITLSGEHKRPQPVDLVPLLRRVSARIAEPARPEHEVRIELPEKLYALVDGERLSKVVENLIINALEAMNRRPGVLTVAAGRTAADDLPFFSVGDTGDGISQKFIAEKLFRPFATTKRRGVGLGLYTCREVVVANAGTITVESQEGVGTTFTVVLPSAALDQDSEQ